MSEIMSEMTEYCERAMNEIKMNMRRMCTTGKGIVGKNLIKKKGSGRETYYVLARYGEIKGNRRNM